MSLPYTNTTCDIYRSTNSPPTAPDVEGVSCVLEALGASLNTTPYWTHRLLVGPSVDLRDDYSSGTLTPGAAADKVYIPDQNGIEYTVVLIRRRGRGTSLDHKEALLLRQTGATITWPTNDL